MNYEEAREAIQAGATVTALTGQGDVYGEGRIISYSMVPTIEIVRADGSRFSWRHDMAEVKE